MRTLRRRLTVGLSAILLLVFVGQWVTLRHAIRKVAEDQVVMHLEHDGGALLSAVELGPDGQLSVNELGVEAVYRQPFSGHYYVVLFDGRPVLASPSLGGHPLPAIAVAPGAKAVREVVGPNGQSVLTLSQGHLLMKRAVSITVGEDLAEMNAQIDEQSVESLGLILPLLVAAVLVQHLTIRQGLEPLRVVHNELERVRHGERGRIEGDVPGEIRPLVDEVNWLLEVVHRRLQQSRTALGNLAHAIKTPLAVLFRIADDPALPPSQGAELKAQSEAIRDRVERELKKARLAGSDRVGAHVNLHAELRHMSDVLAKIYGDKGLEIETEAPDRLVPYDREDLLELLGNLADNACKWARGRVRILVREAAGGGLHLRVSDDGPGCMPETAGRLGQRGVRIDESVAGHGLGLAICQDIVEFYGGTLAMDRDQELGGLAVEVSLPRRG